MKTSSGHKNIRGSDNIHCTTVDIISNPYTGLQFAIDKRRRNLEKRKTRLLQYEADLKDGKQLSEQQIEARSCIGEVDTQLDFLKDLNRTITLHHKDYLRRFKQWEEDVKKEHLEKEQKYLGEFVSYQKTIQLFGKVAVKEAFLNGTCNAVKITADECELIENLAGAFGSNCNDTNVFSEFKEKMKEGLMLAHKILAGSKEKIISNFSGVEVKRLLDKVINCGYVYDDTKEESESIKSEECPSKSEVEQPKSDPRVVFVRVTNGSVESYTADETEQVGDTEFGFEGSAETDVVPDPPSPIPLPLTVASEESAGVMKDGTNIWRTVRDAGEPNVISKRSTEEAEIDIEDGGKEGHSIQHVNGIGDYGKGYINSIKEPISGDESCGTRINGLHGRGMRSGRGRPGYHQFGGTGSPGRHDGNGYDGKNVSKAMGDDQPYGDADGNYLRRVERDTDEERGARYVSRGHGRARMRGSRYGSRGIGGGVGGNEMRSVSSFVGRGRRGDYNGYGYRGLPVRRQAGFNFASDQI